ncbi:MAG: multiheme c-type cytochrome [Myxococcales bacterium]|nr:hypothetical protein [Polyangiaceae bacterium]MDW8248536.1 multiheme c-type cytochrome [Myxococcales bacterium]
MSSLLRFLLLLALVASGSVTACQGCRSGSTHQDTLLPREPSPTVRLYLLSTVAGALEPCGCSKNQLGGIDHLGAYLASERKQAPASLLAAAGPLFFLDPMLRNEHATQDRWKAEALATAFQKTGLVAWAPGANDWADGTTTLASLRERSGAALLAANLSGATAGAAPTVLWEVGGVKVGFVGLSAPARMGVVPEGVEVKPTAAPLRASLDQLKAQGAQVLVGLFALPRGDALRLIEEAPELQVVAVGKPFEQGDANDKPLPPVLLNRTLVVQPSNHLQTVSVVDLHVRDGSFSFQDGTGVQGPPRQPPATGSYFRVSTVNITVDLGRDDSIYLAMLDYYRKVNEHNRTAFADRKAPPPGPDGNRFIGVAVCSGCHAAAREVWDKTPHAWAYKTLADQHKEFNLDCVKCHVTGYEKPGGSTVTDNALLRNVQCEECHGPGGRHVENPSDKTRIVTRPTPESCISSCHHPPHVEGFDAVARMADILGPGHGKK